jgi:hypothetical protein
MMLISDWWRSRSDGRDTSGPSGLVASLLLLNLCDCLATLLFVHRGAEEANPLASVVLGASPWAFVVLKLGIVWLAATLLGILEAYRALGFVIGVYLGVCALHLFALLGF